MLEWTDGPSPASGCAEKGQRKLPVAQHVADVVAKMAMGRQ